MLAIRVEAAAGVEIAHSLFSQMNTAGADRTAPRLQASCRIPWFAAPSPKKQSTTPSRPWRRSPWAAPTAIAEEPATIASAPSMPLSIAVMCMLPPRPRQ